MSRARDFADLAGSSSNISTVAADSSTLDQVATSYGAGGITGKNLIINGALTVSQRGVDINSLGETVYSADRFRTRTYGGNGRFDYDQVTDVVPSSTFKYAAKYTVSTAATDVGSFGYSVQQVIEGHNIAQLRIGRSDAKPFTISFWARSSVSGTYSSGVATNSGDISFVTEFTLVANTWEYISYTVPAYTTSVPTNLNETNGNGLFFTVIGLASQTSKQTSTLDAWQSGNFAFSSNQTNFMSATTRTVHITGVQLEVGSQATPFEHRSYGDELARCQRYYATSGIVLATGTPSRYHNQINLPVTMRVQPTITAGGIDSGSGGTIVSTWDTSNTPYSGRTFYQGSNHSTTSNSRWNFDAEL
jgi:hypothetical protein